MLGVTEWSVQCQFAILLRREDENEQNEVTRNLKGPYCCCLKSFKSERHPQTLVTFADFQMSFTSAH